MILTLSQWDLFVYLFINKSDEYTNKAYMHFDISHRAFVIKPVQVAKRDAILCSKTQSPQHHFILLPEVMSADA